MFVSSPFRACPELVSGGLGGNYTPIDALTASILAFAVASAAS